MMPSYTTLADVPSGTLREANRCALCRVYGGDVTRLELSKVTEGVDDPLALGGLYPTAEAACADADRWGVTIDGAAPGR